jgi:hypothetical protein
LRSDPFGDAGLTPEIQLRSNGAGFQGEVMKLKLNGFGSLLVVLLTVFNIGGLFYLTMEIFTVGTWRGSASGSISMVEAAYLGALWSAVVAKACAGILLNLIVFGWILLNMQIDDRGSELSNARIVAALDTLTDQGRNAQASRLKEPSHPQSAPERPPIQPLPAI